MLVIKIETIEQLLPIDRGRINVQLTSCLTILEKYFLFYVDNYLIPFEYISRPAKQEVSCAARVLFCLCARQ